MAVVSSPETFDEGHSVWQSAPHGLDLRSAIPFVDSSMKKQKARPEQLLSQPVQWARLHYPTLTGRQVRGSGALTITRSGTAHGLLVWFDTELIAGVGYSNAPGVREGIYGQMLFPWPRAESLAEGDTVTYDIRADAVGGETIWTWTTEIRGRGAEPGEVRRTRQSTFGSLFFSPETLQRRAATHAPKLSSTGELALQVLESMRTGKTIGQLAGDLHAAHPGRFRTVEDAHGFVAQLSERYGA
jgi:protein arginine N-methyltransferase 1